VKTHKSVYFICIFGMLAAAGSSTGCGDDGGAPSCATAATLGTGTVDFEPLGTDPELPLIAGTQGGHHFIVHAQARGILPGDPTMVGIVGNPRTRFNLFNENGDEIDYMPPPYTRGYTIIGDCAYQMPSGSILRVDDDQVDVIRGQMVRITLRIEDSRGAVGTDERWVRVVDDPRPDGGLPDGSDAGVADAGVSDATP
jgi:hypothetical protein